MHVYLGSKELEEKAQVTNSRKISPVNLSKEKELDFASNMSKISAWLLLNIVTKCYAFELALDDCNTTKSETSLGCFLALLSNFLCIGSSCSVSQGQSF